MSLRNPLAYGTNAIQLQAGEVWTLPRGWWNVGNSRNAGVQTYDPVSTTWLPFLTGAGEGLDTVFSDGISYRIANPTGCPVCAVVTNGGSGYLTPPTVTPSEGNSQWTAILGSNLTSVTVVAGGANYTYPPLILIAPPPSPGFPATATATLTNGAISSVTLNNVGAGYMNFPTISVINDPRDTAGGGAVLAAVLGNQGKVTGVVCTDFSGGTIISSGTVPTLTFAGGGGSAAAAYAVMAWTVASITVVNGGVGYDTSSGVGIQTYGTGMASSPAAAFTNPRFQGGSALLRYRQASFLFTTSGGVITTLASTLDSGLIGGVVTNIALKVASNLQPTTLATLTLVPGGASDIVYLQAAGPPSP